MESRPSVQHECSTDSFDINFKQIEQTNQILNNIESKLSTLFRKKNSKSEVLSLSRNSSSSNIKSPEANIDSTKNRTKLFSNPIIQESFNNSFSKEKSDEKKNEKDFSEINLNLKNSINIEKIDEPLNLKNFFNLEKAEEKKIQEDLGVLKERLDNLESMGSRIKNFDAMSTNHSNNDYFLEKIKILEERIGILKKENKAFEIEKYHLKEENHCLKEENYRLKESVDIFHSKLKEKEGQYLNEKTEFMKTYNNLKSEHNSLLKDLTETKNNQQNILKEKNDFEEMQNILLAYQSELEKIKNYSKSLSENFSTEISKLQQDLKFQKLENDTIKEEFKQVRIKNNSKDRYSNYQDRSFSENENKSKPNSYELKTLMQTLKNKNNDDFNQFNDLYNDIYSKKASETGYNNYDRPTKLTPEKENRDTNLEKCHEEIQKLKELINTKIAMKGRTLGSNGSALAKKRKKSVKKKLL